VLAAMINVVSDLMDLARDADLECKELKDWAAS
jgi:hypothetical protein